MIESWSLPNSCRCMPTRTHTRTAWYHVTDVRPDVDEFQTSSVKLCERTFQIAAGRTNMQVKTSVYTKHTQTHMREYAGTVQPLSQHQGNPIDAASNCFVAKISRVSAEGALHRFHPGGGRDVYRVGPRVRCPLPDPFVCYLYRHTMLNPTTTTLTFSE